MRLVNLINLFEKLSADEHIQQVIPSLYEKKEKRHTQNAQPNVDEAGRLYFPCYFCKKPVIDQSTGKLLDNAEDADFIYETKEVEERKPEFVIDYAKIALNFA